MSRTALLLVLITAAPAAAQDRHVVVDVLGDPTHEHAIREAIAGELGVATVGPESSGETAEGVVTVAFGADRRVTVTWVPRSGEPVIRAMELPPSVESSIETVALLTGNLARRQADDLLASLTPDEAPENRRDEPPGANSPETPDETLGASPPETPVVVVVPATPALVLAPPRPGAPEVTLEDTRPRRSFSIGIVPPLSTDFLVLDAVHGVSLAAAVGWGSAVEHLALAGAVDVRTGRVDGVQLAGAAAIAAGPVNGAQLAGAAAIAAGPVNGAQIAGAVAIAERVDGVQVSGAVNVAREDVSGAQIGVVNVTGGRVRGVQVGVVNVAERSDAPIGLVSVIRDGRTELDAWVQTDLALGAAVRHGGRYIHNIYALGVRPGRDGTRWTAGLGLGGHVPIGSVALDVDALAHYVSDADQSLARGVSLLAQLRLTLSFELTGPLSLIVGAAANAWISESDDGADLPTGPTHVEEHGTFLRAWPSAHVGLRLH